MFAPAYNTQSMSIEERVKQLIDSIQAEIKANTWVEVRGDYHERCSFMTQDTQMAAKAIAITSVKREMEAAKQCFILYSDCTSWKDTDTFSEFAELLAALEAFEPKSDEI